jgi:hypothetical protein
MKSSWIIVALAWLLLGPAAAFGESFTSDKLAFSADFPFEPTVGDAAGSEVDHSGNFISTSVIVSSELPGVYVAMVTVDSYVVPMKLDVAATPRGTRDDFVKALKASVVSSDPGTRDGRRALFFRYETSNRSNVGSGIVVITQQKKPRIYLVVTTYTPNASAEQIGELDKFVASFHLR